MSPRRRAARFAAVVLTGALATASCGSDSDGSADGPDTTATQDTNDTKETSEMNESVTEAGGLRRVTAQAAADVLAGPPDDLVVLDIRTPEEFGAGHLDDAVLLDFYRTDFADELAGLDRDVPYVLYCNSGNRSGQALELMRSLGFADVAEVDGGIVAWQQAGLPLVTP